MSNFLIRRIQKRQGNILRFDRVINVIYLQCRVLVHPADESMYILMVVGGSYRPSERLTTIICDPISKGLYVTDLAINA